MRINPEEHVEIHNRSLSLEEIKGLIKDWDEVVAEADDLAYSSKVLYMAQEMKKFTATAMPSGYLGYVMSFPPNAHAEKGNSKLSLELKKLERFATDLAYTQP